jgi:hypothetical protein
MADRHGPQNACPTTDIHAIADGRDGTDLVPLGDPERSILADVDVVADRAGMEYDPPVVPDPHSPPEAYDVWQMDAAAQLDELREEPEDQTEWRPQQFGANAHAPVAETVNRDCPETRRHEVMVIGPQVLAEQGEKPDSGRVEVLIPPVQRREIRTISTIALERARGDGVGGLSLGHDLNLLRSIDSVR